MNVYLDHFSYYVFGTTTLSSRYNIPDESKYRLYTYNRSHLPQHYSYIPSRSRSRSRFASLRFHPSLSLSPSRVHHLHTLSIVVPIPERTLRRLGRIGLGSGAISGIGCIIPRRCITIKFPCSGQKMYQFCSRVLPAWSIPFFTNTIR